MLITGTGKLRTHCSRSFLHAMEKWHSNLHTGQVVLNNECLLHNIVLKPNWCMYSLYYKQCYLFVILCKYRLSCPHPTDSYLIKCECWDRMTRSNFTLTLILSNQFMAQESNGKSSAFYKFTPTVVKFCVMWEGQALPHDTKFHNCSLKL